jgi:hypothetical protein
MLVVTAALGVVRDVAGAEREAFRVGYVTEDGAQHQVGRGKRRRESVSPARRMRTKAPARASTISATVPSE